MFSFHGWAVVREAHDESTENPRALADVLRRTEQFIDNEMEFSGRLHQTNGEHHLLTSGASNHYRASPLALFKLLADVSSGSYGLLYVHDDENVEGLANSFQVWVLRKGTLSIASDTFLSPVFPTIESD